MLFYQHSILHFIFEHNWFRPVIAYRSHYKLTVDYHAYPTHTQGTVLGDLAQVIRVLIQSVHSGALIVISTAQWLGSQKLLSRVALTSKWVDEQALPKNFAAQATPGTGRWCPLGNTMLG